jgi:hypothetical protein
MICLFNNRRQGFQPLTGLLKTPTAAISPVGGWPEKFLLITLYAKV